MPYIIKMSFERVVYGTTQVKRFPNLNIIKTLGKGYAIFNCIVYFIQVKALVLLLFLNAWNSSFHVLYGVHELDHSLPSALQLFLSNV